MGVGILTAYRELVCKPEVSLRFSHVFPDLLSQRLDRGELDLPTPPLQERDLNSALRSDIDGMEVEQVGLDREGIRPKGRTITDVGNGIESLTVHARSRHVDAIA